MARRFFDDVDWDFEKPGEASRRLWAALCDHHPAPQASPARGQAPRPAAESVPLVLPGRCLLQDGSELPCEMTDISPLGLGLRGVSGARAGEWAVAHIESVGAVDGVIVRNTPVLFVIDIRATPANLDRLAVRLDWNLRRLKENTPDRRAHARSETQRRPAELKTEEGRTLSGSLLDISEGGAAVHLGSEALYLWEGQPVLLDRKHAYVLRHFPGGVVLRFELREERRKPEEQDAQEA